MRNLGSAIGISVTGALLADQHTGQSRAHRRRAVTPFNRALQTGRPPQFWNPGSIAGAAMLNQEITRQAQIIAYIDDFKLMLVLAIVTAPLVLLTRSSQKV